MVIRPNHYNVIVLGAGQSGTAIAGHLNNLIGLPFVKVMVIEPTSFVHMGVGVDMMPYEITDEEETRQPVLQFINSLNEFKFEEVIHLDPANKFVATYEGSEMTYDYCINCIG